MPTLAGTIHGRAPHDDGERDTHRAMSEKSTTPDLVALTRQSIQATSRREVGGALGFLVRDAVWDMSPMGLGTFEGKAAIRGFTEDWFGAFADFTMDAEEIVDLGGGVVFSVFLVIGRPVNSSADVRQRYASVAEWVEDEIARITNYPDIDDARAAAERLAESRG
jgi:ketosteroid isomerase-like protein